MASTIRTDLVIPEVLEEAIRGEFAGMQALYGTGAAVVSASGWPDARGGDKIKIPYFGTLGEFEDLASDEGAGGALPALTPQKLTMTDEVATVIHSGKAFETTEWARIAAAYADPYAEAARQLRVGLQRRADKELITRAEATTLLSDIYLGAGPTEANRLTWETILGARELWGDEQDDIALVVLHSKVAFALIKQKDANNRPLYEEAVRQGGLIQVPGVGVPVKVSDRLTVTANAGGAGTETAYNSLIIKQNALAFWFSGGEPDVQTDKDILADSTVAAIHVYFAAHRYKRVLGSTKEGVIKIRHNL